eukprot:gnl/TRDRNA2_/TRDRNA2_187789_c0_seq1.p1 gnl/TRDRNA2_/TRDRNA2_187789_c0~~gnl/TRDRNA2_/TRDRNA2_187789_c0_seq1.p1  ORF type:complete len:381 (+),score=95.56 gnl/TRDRNA2_/TRDRNA2_187789_c0_seq1:80-1222(+)
MDRLATLVGQVLPSAVPQTQHEGYTKSSNIPSEDWEPDDEKLNLSSYGTKALSPIRPASVASIDEEKPLVVLLEPPAEEAISKDKVQDDFAIRFLRVKWETEANVDGDKEAVALVTVKKKVDAKMLDKFPKLRLVAVAFTGYDHVDLAECKKRGVEVANVPGYSTDGVAELIFGHIFTLLRHIHVAHQHVRQGKWAWPPGNELAGKRMGIIGTGSIGMRVGEIAKAFRVSKLLGYDQMKNPKFITELGGEYASSLATMFLQADIVVIAVALTPATKGLVNDKLLRLLSPEKIIVNCARGAIIDQEALIKYLSQGRFRAGLDVYELEPLPAESAIRSIPETHISTTPHLAYKCYESLARRQDVTLANILAFLSDHPQNIVS